MEVTQEKLDEFNNFLENECPWFERLLFRTALITEKYDEAQQFMDQVRRNRS